MELLPSQTNSDGESKSVSEFDEFQIVTSRPQVSRFYWIVSRVFRTNPGSKPKTAKLGLDMSMLWHSFKAMIVPNGGLS
jgi:hypothetical protein